MISSIFGKTKPINHIIVLSFLSAFYWFVNFVMPLGLDPLEGIYKKLLVLAVLLLSVFMTDFVVKKNKMTDTNSFAILLYAMLTVVFPETLTDANAIFCSFFLLLATRRLISIRTLKDIRLKILDATLWILISSLFYDWAVIYLFLVFAAIYIYEPNNIRNWAVPFVGVFVFFMIAYGFLILVRNEVFLREHYNFVFDFDLRVYLVWLSSAKLLIFVVLVLLSMVFSFLKLGNSGGLGKIMTLRLMVLSFAIGIVLKVLISSGKDYPLMVTFFPAVIFMTNYIESIKRASIKEIVLMAVVIIPFLVFLSGILLN